MGPAPSRCSKVVDLKSFPLCVAKITAGLEEGMEKFFWMKANKWVVPLNAVSEGFKNVPGAIEVLGNIKVGNLNLVYFGPLPEGTTAEKAAQILDLVIALKFVDWIEGEVGTCSPEH